MKTINWPLTGLFAVLVVALVVGTFQQIAPTCDADMLTKAAEKGVIFSCPEFWLNRYQSLLGNLLTAAVAGATLIWVARQFTATNQQAAVASAQGLRLYAEELELLVQQYNQAKANVGRCFAPFKDAINTTGGTIKPNPTPYIDILREIEQTLKINNIFEVRHNSPKFAEETQWIRVYCDEAMFCLSMLAETVADFASIKDPKSRVLQFAGLSEYMEGADKNIQLLAMAVGGRSQLIYEELRQVWDRIRMFEQIAVHGSRPLPR